MPAAASSSSSTPGNHRSAPAQKSGVRCSIGPDQEIPMPSAIGVERTSTARAAPSVAQAVTPIPAVP